MRASRRSAAERLRVGWLLTGAAGLRRAYHDSERLGARGSAWPCVSALRRPGRRPVYSARFISDWRRGGPRGSCQGILGWVNGFATCRKRLVQANACSGRPSRAPAMERAAGGPAHHGRSCGRSREGVPPRRNSLAIGALFTRGVHCATGFAPWWVLDSSLTLCAARDQRVPAGKSGRSLRLGALSLLLIEGVARCRRRRASHKMCGACATPTPFITAHARAAARRVGAVHLASAAPLQERRPRWVPRGRARSVALRVPRSARVAPCARLWRGLGLGRLPG